MTKIDRDKIVRAAIGSARLEGYKGTLSGSTKKAKVSQTKSDSKATAKR
jgi:hypothetical protein